MFTKPCHSPLQLRFEFSLWTFPTRTKNVCVKVMECGAPKKSARCIYDRGMVLFSEAVWNTSKLVEWCQRSELYGFLKALRLVWQALGAYFNDLKSIIMISLRVSKIVFLERAVIKVGYCNLDSVLLTDCFQKQITNPSSEKSQQLPHTWVPKSENSSNHS